MNEQERTEFKTAVKESVLHQLQLMKDASDHLAGKTEEEHISGLCKLAEAMARLMSALPEDWLY